LPLAFFGIEGRCFDQCPEFEEMVMTIKVFLLDDHEVVRLGLHQLLDSEPDIDVVGDASTAAEAIARIPAVRPDVAVLDVRLPDGDGISVCREVRSSMADPPACLMLTSYSDDQALFTAIMAGASGYLLKQINGGALIDAVRRLAAGESLLDPAMTMKVLERLRHPVAEEDPRYAALTEQERRILAEIAEGKTNRQIAQSLYLAEKTVKNYVSSLLRKLSLERRTEAAVFAIEHAKNFPQT
jgi:DNA-binding NarL/FixJ family response regulator